MMKPGIVISRLWFDVDVVELRIRVSDGTSSFSNDVYVAHATLEDAVSSLQAFRNHVHGGLLDLQFGEFGPEFAKGVFHVRFHFLLPGRLFVTCKQEAEFVEFGNKQVASKATLYVKTEPVLLDYFIKELEALAARTSAEAQLEGI
jgi:hypothetical protein